MLQPTKPHQQTQIYFCFKPPCLWGFVTAVPGNQCIQLISPLIHASASPSPALRGPSQPPACARPPLCSQASSDHSVINPNHLFRCLLIPVSQVRVRTALRTLFFQERPSSLAASPHPGPATTMKENKLHLLPSASCIEAHKMHNNCLLND